MSIVICWSQRTLKQLEREQTDTQTDTQDDYSNPRACAPRVNESAKPSAENSYAGLDAGITPEEVGPDITITQCLIEQQVPVYTAHARTRASLPE